MTSGQCKFCSAQDFYLGLLKVTFEHRRYHSGIVRTAVDNLVAILNGYASNGKHAYSGNWGKYKRECFASQQALALGEEIPHMEHVVPLKVVWEEILLPKWATGNFSDEQILSEVNYWVIPCLITEFERVALDEEYKSSMPKHWTSPWARYDSTDIQIGSSLKYNLLTQIHPVRQYSRWDDKNLFPQPRTPIRGLPVTKQLKCTCGSSKI